MGYSSISIPVLNFNRNHEIGLKQLSISLQEVIIRSSEPRTLIENAISKKPDNYPLNPSMIRSFYRESLKRNNKYMMYTEGLLDIYKSSYGPTIYTDQVRLIKKRKYTNISQYDTVMFRLRGGIQSSLSLDLIKNPLEFIEAENLYKYNYHLSDIIVHNGRLVYLIDFHERKINNELLYFGSIYLDINKLAIVKIEFGLTPSSLKYARRSFVVKRSPRVKVKPVNVNYEINYREINGKYYINHITGELKLKVKKKGKFLNAVYETRFEMISTDIDSVNIKRFTTREKMNRNTIFSKSNLDYENDFWENENFIIPEDDLAKALSRFTQGELEITRTED